MNNLRDRSRETFLLSFADHTFGSLTLATVERGAEKRGAMGEHDVESVEGRESATAPTVWLRPVLPTPLRTTTCHIITTLFL
jgi:hypothetical protein